MTKKVYNICKIILAEEARIFPYTFQQSHISTLLSTGSDASVEINV